MYGLLIYYNDEDKEVFKLGHIADFKFSLVIRLSFRFLGFLKFLLEVWNKRRRRMVFKSILFFINNEKIAI